MLVVCSALMRAKEVYEIEHRQGGHSNMKIQLAHEGAQKIDVYLIVRGNSYLQTPLLPPLDNL